MTTLKLPDLTRRISTPLIAAVLGALVLAAALYWEQQPMPSPPPLIDRMAPMPVSQAIEATYGVRIAQVALIADGGLVDLRYTVIDPDRAALMTNSLEGLPVIVAGDGTALDQRGAGHRHGQRLEAGTTYFLLYTNSRNALRPGDRVMVRVGDLALADVPVR